MRRSRKRGSICGVPVATSSADRLAGQAIVDEDRPVGHRGRGRVGHLAGAVDDDRLGHIGNRRLSLNLTLTLTFNLRLSFRSSDGFEQFLDGGALEVDLLQEGGISGIGGERPQQLIEDLG